MGDSFGDVLEFWLNGLFFDFCSTFSSAFSLVSLCVGGSEEGVSFSGSDSFFADGQSKGGEISAYILVLELQFPPQV